VKFQSPLAFEKSLKSADLPRSFLFVSPCDYEKRLWTETVIEQWKKKEPQAQVVRLSALDVPLTAIEQEMESLSLWGGIRIVIVDAADKIKALRSPPPDVVLILLASSFKPVAELSMQVVLDMSGEKPWDRDRRIQEWARERVRKEGKEIASDVIMQLISSLGTECALLDQELKKLVTYVGTKKNIELKDVAAICGSRDLSTGWLLSETLVWKHPIALQEKMKDLGFVFPFLGQVRYQLQLGAQLAELLERKMDSTAHLPSVRPQNITKFAPIAARRKLSFFLNGIVSLYEFEFSAKSSSVDLGVMFDLFQARLYEASYSAS
jgi:DNA polymerase-3 subunit delta